MTSDGPNVAQTLETALWAYGNGYTPIPIKAKTKMPSMAGWTRLKYEDESEVRDKFNEWAEEGYTNIGVLLGEPSGGLVDIDLDNPLTNRLKRHFLPPTDLMTGRPGRPASHYWYQVEEGTLPGNRRHKMPDKTMAVELRSTGSQTLLPPSVHPSGENYSWDHVPYGEPAVVNGQLLATQVALLALGTVLIDCWPEEGGRHEAYLALAGGVLRNTDGGVHPFWERNLPVLIAALADATHDDDGADTRVQEVMGTTLKRLRAGEKTAGFGKLGEAVGTDVTRQIRLLLREVESSAGYTPRETSAVETASDGGDFQERLDHLKDEVGGLDPEERDPLNERIGTWQPVDLEPFLAGQVRMQEPEVLTREDGQSLMYRGRVNMLYGSSESAKSWIALQTCLQEMAQGERVVYLDFEDEPINTLDRLQRLGAGGDDLRHQFSYIRPEEPLSPMQRNKWGQSNITEDGQANLSIFEHALSEIDPSLIIADGMTVLYGLHGLDSNDSVSTDVITTWLKKLTRNGRSTVIVIDHIGKGGKKGAQPIGSQHKVAMVQGTMLQVWPIKQPMPGRLGEIELVVTKDRPGMVRAASEDSGGGKAQVSARVLMDSREDGITRMTIDKPLPGPKSAGDYDMERTRAAERAAEAKEWEERVKHLYGGELGRKLSLPFIIRELRSLGQPAEIKAAVARLVDQNWLERRGQARGRVYVLMVGGGGYESEEDELAGEQEV